MSARSTTGTAVCDCLPTHAEVLAAVGRGEPATAEEIRVALGVDWPQRGTLWNRLCDLEDQGLLITDEGRPRRFALNQLTPELDR